MDLQYENLCQLVLFSVYTVHRSKVQWKKRSEETQTLCTDSSKTEPKNFAPPQTPFPGTRNGQNLISWRW